MLKHARFYAILILGAAWLTLALLAALPAHAACGQVASWYGPGFHGRQTASGETYNQWGMTAAHKTLAFGTVVRVTLDGRSVTVRINDRGPFIPGRVIDLSRGAADALGMIDAGVVPVCITIVEQP